MTSKAKKIFLTQVDFQKLAPLVETCKRMGGGDKRCLLQLDDELKRAEILPPEEIPSDVVTLNSRMRLLDIDLDEEMEYTLVLPEKAVPEKDLISVLSPIGTAIIGCREGEEIEWEIPAGRMHLRILEILYQPEAAGQTGGQKAVRV